VYHEIHDRPHIRGLLEDYRIGNLTAADTATLEVGSITLGAVNHNLPCFCYQTLTFLSFPFFIPYIGGGHVQ
jgi:hypothetical protein